jgi:hypothetical protein
VGEVEQKRREGLLVPLFGFYRKFISQILQISYINSEALRMYLLFY